MGAFAAVLNLDGSPVDPDELREMTEPVSHRGPDGIGQWVSGHVGLARCLLRTTPEDSFEQPLNVAESGPFAIAFDGRVDNRKELAAKLDYDEPALAVTPDSVLLLTAYRKWGEECLRHVAGDFAFALWDSEKRSMFCARDPLGVRLLHYSLSGTHFRAATEVAQLGTVSDSGLDPVTIATFLDVRSAPPNRTFLKDIRKLPAGCSMTVSASGLHVRAFWNPDPSRLLNLKDDREYEERFLELFRESVRSKSRASGPVGVSLSGGMDSSSVLATAEHLRQGGPQAGGDIRYFSNIYSNMPDIDESGYIDETVGLYGTQGRRIESGGFEGEAARHRSSPLGRRRAEPLVAPHEESHRMLFAAAQSEGCRVLLTGVGGDEIFSVGEGYLEDVWRGFDLRTVRREWRYFTKKAWIAAAWRAALSRVMPWRDGASRRPVSATWLLADARADLELAKPMDWESGRAFSSRHVLEVEHWLQLRGTLAGNTWLDVTVAEYGLEVRHPFLDRRVVEFLLSVPPHLKFRYGYNKRVLRRAMKGILPEEVRNRRYKTNFTSLFDLKAAEHAADEIAELLEAPVLGDLGIVDAASLTRAWTEYQGSADSVDGDRRTALWAAITVEQWLRSYMVEKRDENETGESLVSAKVGASSHTQIGGARSRSSTVHQE